MEGDWGTKWFGDGVDDGFYHCDSLYGGPHWALRLSELRVSGDDLLACCCASRVLGERVWHCCVVLSRLLVIR